MSDTSKNEFVFIDSSPIHGSGLFAARTLAKGQLIGVYEGPEVTRDGPYVLWVEDDMGEGWTGHEGENEMRFMNHADAPNAEMDGLYCYSINHIERGDEITIDYGWNDS